VGIGVGSQAGAEMTDFLVVLNSRAAIRSFMAAGSLTLGGNLSIALGPLGRNGEAAGSVNTKGKVAAMYSYSKTRGLFGGVSLEGSVIVERQDANRQAYESPVTVKLLLGGMVEPPAWADSLIHTLNSCTGMPRYKKWVDDYPDPFMNDEYAFGSQDGSRSDLTTSTKTRSYLKKKRRESDTFPPASWGRRTDSGAYFYDDTLDQSLDFPSPQFNTTFDTDYGYSESQSHQSPLLRSEPQKPSTLHPNVRSSAAPTSLNWNPVSSANYNGEVLTRSSDPRFAEYSASDGSMPHAIALYNFQAAEPGDLSFFKGEIITITQMSDKTDDWWTGRIGERKGIFPANFVEVV
jgi:hypothetical protein